MMDVPWQPDLYSCSESPQPFMDHVRTSLSSCLAQNGRPVLDPVWSESMGIVSTPLEKGSAAVKALTSWAVTSELDIYRVAVPLPVPRLSVTHGELSPSSASYSRITGVPKSSTTPATRSYLRI